VYPKYKSLEDCELIAWHHMLNDPWLSTYTMEQDRMGRWVEHRKFVNPKLQFRRQMDALSVGIQKMAQTIQDAFFGPMTNLAETMQSFLDQITDTLLGTSFDVDHTVE
jgi:hypothetical protein